MRWLSAALFVAATGAALYLMPNDLPDSHETAWTVGLVILYFVSGALVGRWWALPLAFVPVLLAIPAGTRGDADGTPLWWWVLIDTAIVFVWIMFAGVLAGWATRALLRGTSARRRRFSPQTSEPK